jgi:hypothetical protein
MRFVEFIRKNHLDVTSSSRRSARSGRITRYSVQNSALGDTGGSRDLGRLRSREMPRSKRLGAVRLRRELASDIVGYRRTEEKKVF